MNQLHMRMNETPLGSKLEAKYKLCLESATKNLTIKTPRNGYCFKRREIGSNIQDKRCKSSMFPRPKLRIHQRSIDVKGFTLIPLADLYTKRGSGYESPTKISGSGSPKNKLYSWLTRRNKAKRDHTNTYGDSYYANKVTLFPNEEYSDIPCKEALPSVIKNIRKNIQMMKLKQMKRENDFIRNFNQKKKIANLYKSQYKIKFSNYEFSNLSPVDLIKLGDEKRYRILALKREEKAALTIQTAFRKYLAKKRFIQVKDAYITPFGYTFKDLERFTTAATKIQQFYRFMKHCKKVIQIQEERKVIRFK